MHHLPEADWKRCQALHATALDRLCASILEEAMAAARDPKQSHHQRFLAVYSIVNNRNEEIARIFDRASRSRCRGQIASMRAAGLLTDGELEVLTPETLTYISSLLP
jgi:hypothetical protein